MLWQQLLWRCGADDTAQLAMKLSLSFLSPPSPPLLQAVMLTCGYSEGEGRCKINFSHPH